jgi:hypothetical protein
MIFNNTKVKESFRQYVTFLFDSFAFSNICYMFKKMKVLSKSRFKLGLECSKKLYYTSNKNYANRKTEDSFLIALAQGGFQVEALARLNWPNGIMINAEAYEYERAAQMTMDLLLQNDEVVIFEAAFLWEGFYIRTDVLVKKGNTIELIEVKAKSFNSNNANEFVGVSGELKSNYLPYLFDLAFQKWVFQNATEKLKYNCTAFFMMADKSKTATVNGLNQMFRVPKNGNPRTGVQTINAYAENIAESVLGVTSVDALVGGIIGGLHTYKGLPFIEAVNNLKAIYERGVFSLDKPNLKTCKTCEFKAKEEDREKGLLCGFENCMRSLMEFNDADFDRPLATGIWNFRDTELIHDRIFMDNIQRDNFEFDEDEEKFSRQHRQWIQVEKNLSGEMTPKVLLHYLNEKMSEWVYPYHCIDFETSAVALPFNAGRRPYEQTAFQFSHHLMHEDGRIEHQTEYINVTPGEFPNFEFARELKKALENDNGTIFKYATHENTIVNAIITQLEESNEPDQDVLIEWLRSISYRKENNVLVHSGPRNMVDLRALVVDTYYNPLTEGSNSIKAVLPAILKTSELLKEKYTQAIQDIGVSSKNFEGDHVWLVDGENPYKNLPQLFEGWTEELVFETVSELEEIKDGGAAMTAYAKLQYTDMGYLEREEIKTNLLKYCELDTLSMCMLIEHFIEIKNGI